MSEKNQQPEENEDVSLYDKLSSRTEEILADSKKSLDEALKKASDELAAGGQFSRDQAEKIGGYLRRDMETIGKQFSKARETVHNAAEPHRVMAGLQSGMAKLLHNAAALLTDLAEASEQNIEFKTGEVTSPGTLTCKDCGKELHLKSTARIPPCPSCHKTLFRKSF